MVTKYRVLAGRRQVWWR